MSNADSAAAELPGARQGTFEPRLVGIQIGRDTISRATDAALEDIEAWRTMPLDSVSPNVPRARVTVDGKREVLGIWWQQTEGARFWLAVLNDLRRRGVHDVDRLGEAASLVEDASFAKRTSSCRSLTSGASGSAPASATGLRELATTIR